MITFLERFQRLLHLHREGADPLSKQVGFSARQFCRYTQRGEEFLDFKPSAIAAACLLLAFNLSRSEVGPQIGLDQYMDIAKYVPVEIPTASMLKAPLPAALSYWSTTMRKVTKLDSWFDISPVY